MVFGKILPTKMTKSLSAMCMLMIAAYIQPTTLKAIVDNAAKWLLSNHGFVQYLSREAVTAPLT